MRAVLDTNVLISGVITTGVSHDVLLLGFRGAYQLVVTVETLTEFRDTLYKYPEKFHLDDDEIQREVETIRYFAEFVVPDVSISAVEDDPDDDKFLDAAVAGEVDYLVSGDRHLLDLGTYSGIEIVDPRTFYDRFNET